MKSMNDMNGVILNGQRPLIRSVMGLRSGVFNLLLIVAIIWAGAGIAHLWVRHQNMRMGYAISDQEDLRESLQTRNMALRIQLTSLKSRERIEPLARQNFGMDLPKTGQVIELSTPAGVVAKVVSQ